MDLVRFSIEKPVTVIVGVIFVVLFGLIGLARMPYQLSPTVEEPVITVSTFWRGATPYEMEREIIEPQEEALKGIPGLVELESEAFNSRGTVTLRFKIGTDVDDALLRVSNKLNEVQSYPENVEKPIINATGAATSPVIWMVLKADEDNPRPVETYLTFFEDEIRQHLERVEGVADLFVGGGRKKELHVIVNPERLAAYNLTVSDMMNALRAENVNVSAGSMGVGRRDFRIRTTGEFKTVEDVENVVLKSTGQRRVFLHDVAEVKLGYAKREAKVMHNARGGIAVGIKPEPGTNILELTDGAWEIVQWLNREKLKPEKIYLDWVYDQRPYINGAIDLIQRNILIGGTLAVIVLLVFLRSASSTLVVATALPISVIGTFMFMNVLDRNLNVISLAGIAFAVGMLVDSAIVVIENIDRHRKMGKRPFDAAYDGTREVWGAILASTLTTVAVFLPVVFIEEEAGQLFRDIAIAVTFAVSLSLFVSVSVIPMLSRTFFRISKRKPPAVSNAVARLGGRAGDAIMGVVSLAVRSRRSRLVTVFGLTVLALLASYLLLPKTDYLPQGNRNLVINLLIPPPGLSYEERVDIGEYLFKAVEPHMGRDHQGFPGIENMFYVGAGEIMLAGAISTHEQRAGELVPLFTRIIHTIPGMFGVSLQAAIFQTRVGRARTIDVDLSGADLDRIAQSAGALFGAIRGAIPDAQVRPVPSLELLYPEVLLVPLRDRLLASGMSSRDLGVAMDVLMDGREVGEFKPEGQKKMDLVLMTSEEEMETPEELYGSLVVTPQGRAVPVSSLARLERASGINQIRHLERNRTITLQVTPSLEMPLQTAMDTINETVLPPLRGMLTGLNVSMSGTADKLTDTRKALQWNFILAALIAYLLMSALFGNFIYPLVIMFTVPLAGVGGIIGFTLLKAFVATQTMDVLTMLGFVILVGVVVNNAILIVHQALNNVRLHGMDHKEAVLESTRTRLRPIYMSASTSIFGMLPLVVFPGAGSELYRGLGSVVLGGLAFSTVFTVFVVPSLLMFAIRMEKKWKEPGE